MRCMNELTIAVRFRQRCLKTETALKSMNICTEDSPAETRLMHISSVRHLVEIPKEHITVPDYVNAIKVEHESVEHSDIDQDENKTSKFESRQDKQNLDPSNNPSTARTENTQYKCEICGDGFSKQYDLTYHMRIHAADRPFRCEICGNRYIRKSELTHHQRSHSSDRPRKCEICGKEFYKTGNLTQHMRSHTGERQFKCDICGRDFFRKTHLTEHRRLHTGERPHKCEICGQEFSRSTDYTHHMRVHSGERPYKCDHCGAEFYRSSSLVCHQRIHKKPKDATVRGRRRKNAKNVDTIPNGSFTVDETV
ncbi:zinc finger protein 626-like isoform X2 [Malaya genurostris]|nr:zinc finger protein 626-like isoform X2 [Malaya genurostris]